MDQFQTTLYEFIRRLGLDDDRLDALDMRVNRLAEGIRNLWTDGGGSNACVTTITGKIVGGLTTTLTPMPNTSLRVVGHTTGTDYGTFGVPTGSYSLGLILDSSDTSLDLYPTGPVSPRFTGASPLAYTRAVTLCTTNALAAVTPPAASGYGYILESVGGIFACQYPIGTLAWTDSLIGSGTTTLGGFGPFGISGVGIWASACQLGNSFLSGFCVAKTGVPIRLFMNQSSQANIQFNTVSLANFCPQTAACPGNTNGLATFFVAAITSNTCPAFDLSTKFDRTWAVNDQPWHNSAAHTIRFYEP